MYDRQHSVPPPQSGPQLVPPVPSGHYPAPSYYSSYSPGGQCYSHNIQPPYLGEETKYDKQREFSIKIIDVVMIVIMIWFGLIRLYFTNLDF